MKLSFFVKIYVCKRAKRLGENMPKDMGGILRKELSLYSSYDKKIVFSWLWDGGGKVPNASATIPGIIFVNAEWAARLVLYPDDKEMHDAFELTMGHEFTHQENDYFFLEPFTKNEKFVYWVNEIHADFGGVQKAFDGKVERGVCAMRYKKKSKLREDKDTFTHPSWEKRIKFLMEYDFNETLIRDVAKIVGCKNEQLISKVSTHFEEIKIVRNS